MFRRDLALLFVAGLLAAGAEARSAAPVDLRTLPTVVKVWGRAMGAQRLAVRHEALYVKNGGRVAALSVRSGREAWSRDLGEEGCCSDEMLVTDATVVTAAEGSLFFLSAADGTTRARLDVDGGISLLAGPPVVALVARTNELLAVDPDSGQVTGRLPLADEVKDLAVQDGYAVLNLAAAEDDSGVTAGYTADALKPVWRIETPRALPQLEQIGGRVHLARRSAHEGRDNEFLPIDSATGRLGRPLPARRGNAVDPGWPWEIQSLRGEGEGSERLRRNDLESGKAVWTTALPCRVEAVARDKDALYASCGRGGGRGVLAILSWVNGEIRQLAYGLPRGDLLLLAGDLVVAAGSNNELAAFSTKEFGPPEAGLSVDAEVRRILLDTRGDDAPLARGEWIEDRLKELEPLGPAALPAIVRLLPKLGPTSMVAAADALAAGGFRAAAPALAGQLAGKLEEPQPAPGLEGWNPQFALLRALAQLGGDAEVPVLAALLDRRSQPASVRREALATLVALRSPAAERAVRAFLARPLPRPAPWNPPTAPAGAIGADLPEGGRLLLFSDGYLGSPDDLWVSRLDRDGRPVGPARFTGLRLPETPEAEEGERMRARVVGEGADRVEVLDGAGRKVAVFRLSEIARDSDGDGLTDLVERRLGLDPAKADTDGDGLPDAADPAPNARLREPVDDEQEVAAALFRQLFELDEDGSHPPQIAVMVSDFALEWRGRRDLTITLDGREAERFVAATGGGGVPLLSIRPGEPAVVTPIGGDPPSAATPPARDEAVCTLTVDRGPLHATVVYRVVLRNLNAAQPAGPHLWAIRYLRPVWIGSL
jgi:hypothetical protein